MRALAVIIAFAPALLFAAPADRLPADGEPLGEVLHRGTVPPRGTLVYRFDPGDGTFTQVSELPGRVGELEATALAAVPAWVRADLLANLERLPDDVRASYLELLVDLAGDRVIDEVAFLLAHLPPSNLQDEGFDPAVLAENADGIYRQAERLDYATIVEVDDDGDGPYTTLELRYRDESGAAFTEELPRDIYYWYVLHPRLDGEKGGHVDPGAVTIPGDDRLAPPPQGVFWRSYFPDPGAYDVADYRDHLLWKVVGTLSADDLSGWGPSATGHLAMPAIDPLVLATDADGAPLVLETRIGRGIVLATTLRIEAAAQADNRKPLWAFLRYGPGNIDFLGRQRTLVVRDAAGATTVADEMAFLGFPMDEADADELAAVDLSGYGKLIVAEDAPLAVWDALAARGDDLQAWVGAGGMLEVHGATAADWSGLPLPAGVVRVDDVAVEDVVLGGWPGWSDVVEGATWVWDGTERSLSGERFLDPDASVLDRVGYWVSQNLADNVSERGEKMGFPPERAQHGERILVNHYGNCGELQDALTTGTRTALVPIRNTSNSNEDHVWNQVWHAGAWHTYQVSWSDGGTEIARPGVSAERIFNESGQGKDISFVSAYRGDGLSLNVTADYTETVTLELEVRDANGAPVDGAYVLFASETYYSDEELIIGHWAWTDTDGRLSIDVGDAQNVYIRVETPLGSYPPEDNRVALAVAAEDGVPGATVTLTRDLDAALPNPPTPSCAGSPALPENPARMAIDLAVEGEYVCKSSVCDRRDSGRVTVVLLDEEGYEAFLAGESDFDAIGDGALAATVGAPATLTESVPDSPVYLVVAAPGRYAFAPFVTLEAAAARPIAPPPPVDEGPRADVVEPDVPTSPQPDASPSAPDAVAGADATGSDALAGGDDPGSGGGSCNASGRPAAPPVTALLLLALLAIVTLRRSKRPLDA